MAAVAVAVVVVFGAIWLGNYVYRNLTAPPEKPFEIGYIHRTELGPYYMSVEEKIGHEDLCIVDGGVIFTDIEGLHTWFHPVKTSHIGMAHYARFLRDGSRDDLEVFLRAARAFVANRVDQEDGTAVWPSYWRSFRGQRVPWYSAMGQGHAIAVLVRAYQETDDPVFLDVARRALGAFEKDIECGGVRSDDPERGVFFEEYAFFEEGRRHHTLNGMLSALFGVYDLWKVTKEERVRKIFDEGCTTIRRNLAGYDFAFCSSYDLRHEHGERPLFHARYNSVHVSHLKILSAMTGDGYFAGVADIWDKKLKDPINRLRLCWWYFNWKLADLGREYRDFGVRKASIMNLRKLGLRLGLQRLSRSNARSAEG